jgi:hypothetical protein
MRKKILAAVPLAVIALLLPATAAQAAAPVNDDITTATPIPAISPEGSFTDTVNTQEATYAEYDLGCGLATVWYRFTPSEDLWAELETVGSDYDTELALATGTPQSLALEQCNDDSDYGLQSQIVAQLREGVTYYISAGTCCGGGDAGQIGPGGTLVLNARVVPDPLTTVSVTLAPAATVSRSGVVTASGTVTCDQPGSGYVGVQLMQILGRRRITGSGYGGFTCGPAATQWTAQVWSDGPYLFGGGKATADIYGDAWGNGAGGASFYLPAQALRLRRSA